MHWNQVLSKIDKLLDQIEERQGLNEAQNMHNNWTHDLFMKQSGPSLNPVDFDTKDEVLILADKDHGNSDETDREG